MNDVSKGAYKTPETEFKGKFIGSTTINNEIETYAQINNFYIDTGVLDG